MTRMIQQSKLTVGGIDLKTPPLPAPPRVTLGEPPEEIKVVCVWWGDAYGVEYVKRLRNSVAKHLPIPHEFICITDKQVPDGVTRIPPFNKNAETWWQKVNLFSPTLFGRNHRVLYLDLDVVIIGSLFDIVRAEEDFCMIENYGPNKAHAAHNSSVMLWTPSDDTQRIFTSFTPDVMKELHGDQCWIWRVMRDKVTNFHQDQAISYKYEKHRQWQHRSEDSAVLVFHGKPKPHEVVGKDVEVTICWS